MRSDAPTFGERVTGSTETPSIDRTDLAIFASSGAFTGIQIIIGTILGLILLAGILLLQPDPWQTVLVIAA